MPGISLSRRKPVAVRSGGDEPYTAKAERRDMEQIKGVKLFELEAALLLPGFLYSFNIADFKRRNCHLGHRLGDADIAELDDLIAAAARPDGTARRIGGDRWLLLSRSNANERVQDLLTRYQRAEPFTSGWRVRATRDGQERV